MKDLLEARKELLNRHAQGGRGLEFNRGYAALMDELVVELFQEAAGTVGGAESLALAALGGYGRGELAPFSDVDLLFLTVTATDQKKFGRVIEAVLYPLWDLKLEVGHAVRTPGQGLDMAREDFATLSTQLDARFLAGNRALYGEFESQLGKHLASRVSRQDFFKRLTASVAERHGKYGESPYLLEPNVKEGQGGLRDIHAITWCGRALYRAGAVKDLAPLGLLSRERVDELEQAHGFMTDVRLQVQRLSGRRTDALSFDLQAEVAGCLGFGAAGGFTGVERFMQEYYSHVYRTKSTLDYFLSRVREDLTPARMRRLTGRPHRVEKGLSILRGQVELSNRGEVRERPLLLMRAFEVSAGSGLPLSPRTVELIRSNLDLVDDEYRRDPAVARSFLGALTALPPLSSRTPHHLDAMPILPFLGAYLPELGGVRAQVQHDAYHVYTVDVHLVATVWEIQKIALGRSDPAANGFEKSVFEKVGNKEVLFLAALLHDVGKGRGRDHARQGAEMMPEACRRLGLSEEEAETLSFLVSEHLYLVHLAMRRDLTEEKLIVNCARKIGDVERLNMLYLLTVADSRATGPGVYNQWKAGLLRDLYLKVHRVLTKSDLAGRELARRTDALLLEVAQALENRLPPEEVDAHLEKMSAHYLAMMNADQVVRHIFLERELVEGRKQVVWEVEAKEEGHCEVTIAAHDRPGLLSRMAGVFTLHHINILGAQVFTRANNIALDVFQVEHPPDRVREAEVWARVREDSLRALTGHLALDYRLARKKPLLRPGKTVTQIPDQVNVDNETSDFYTIVEVFTYDRLGLLYEITKTLFDLQLSINIAKISTKVEQVVDVFYVRDFFGQKLTDQDQIGELKDALLYTLKR
ncbi:MAG: [protein-PII] uridylyltransferase [Thermodesulfobacteriota bacterium]